jgi:hypothetical protein
MDSGKSTRLTIKNWIGAPLREVFSEALLKLSEIYPYSMSDTSDYRLIEKSTVLKKHIPIKDYNQPIGNFKEKTVLLILKRLHQ